MSADSKLKIRITDFIYFSDYFTAFMREQRALGSRITYRSLSKSLGLASTSNLAMIAIGRRHPNRELLDSLCLQLGLSSDEMEYARFMIGYEKAKNSDEKQLFWERLSGLRPTDDEEIDLDRLAIISQWEYLLLICLAGEKKGIPYPLEDLSRALKHRISVKDLEERIRYLETHGFLQRDAQSEIRLTNKVLSTPHEASSTVLKSLHQQTLKLASEEIYQQDIEDRYFSSVFMTASPKKITRAKELLNTFRSDFDRMMAEEDENEAVEVYQLGLQFFKMTHLVDGDKKS